MPVRGIIGTDYLKVRPEFKVLRNPYGDDDIVIVPAITPDVAIFHAFRADEEGNVVTDRHQNNWLLAQAAQKVIVSVEETVPAGDLVRGGFDPVVTAFHVDAVVASPRGAHPTGCRGYYEKDARHIHEYLRCARDEVAFREYVERFVLPGERHYLEMVGAPAKEASGS